MPLSYALSVIGKLAKSQAPTSLPCRNYRSSCSVSTVRAFVVLKSSYAYGIPPTTLRSEIRPSRGLVCTRQDSDGCPGADTQSDKCGTHRDLPLELYN